MCLSRTSCCHSHHSHHLPITSFPPGGVAHCCCYCPARCPCPPTTTTLLLITVPWGDFPHPWRAAAWPPKPSAAAAAGPRHKGGATIKGPVPGQEGQQHPDPLAQEAAVNLQQQRGKERWNGGATLQEPADCVLFHCDVCSHALNAFSCVHVCVKCHGSATLLVSEAGKWMHRCTVCVFMCVGG